MNTPYKNPILFSIIPERLHCSLQNGYALQPSCGTTECGTEVGAGTLCCNLTNGCPDQGLVDDDIVTTFFLPNRTDTSEPSCVIIAGGGDFTGVDCELTLVNSSCGSGQIWRIQCGFNEDTCLFLSDPDDVQVRCEGNTSSDCGPIVQDRTSF